MIKAEVASRPEILTLPKLTPAAIGKCAIVRQTPPTLQVNSAVAEMLSSLSAESQGGESSLEKETEVEIARMVKLEKANLDSGKNSDLSDKTSDQQQQTLAQPQPPQLPTKTTSPQSFSKKSSDSSPKSLNNLPIFDIINSEFGLAKKDKEEFEGLQVIKINEHGGKEYYCHCGKKFSSSWSLRWLFFGSG